MSLFSPGCFRCGQPGHWARSCPSRARSKAPAPPASPAQEIPGPAVVPVPATRGDYAAWASYARSLITPASAACGDPADLHQSPFRLWSGRRAPIDGCELRQMAAAQVADSHVTQPRPGDFPGGLPAPPEYPAPGP